MALSVVIMSTKENIKKNKVKKNLENNCVLTKSDNRTVHRIGQKRCQNQNLSLCGK